MEMTMNYEFQVILKEGTEITEELADRLFAAGCDDGTPGTFCGVPCISFGCNLWFSLTCAV